MPVATTVITGPIPPYSNPPIEPQNFEPSNFFITAIALGQTTTVTTSVNNNFVIGQQVRLHVPQQYGSRGLGGQTGNVIAIPAPNQVVLDIYSVGIDPFVIGTFGDKPQITAIGDINNGTINPKARASSGTFIPGSFINISPQ